MAKTLVGDCWRLEIGFVQREGYLTGGGRFGGVTWTRGERKTGAIGLMSWPRALAATYAGAGARYRLQDVGDGEIAGLTLSYSVNGAPECYPVLLTYTTLASGGRRPWFVCPAALCGRRCGVLYLAPGGRIFACRRCYDLAYPCQQDRTARRDPWEALLRTKGARAALAAAEAEIAGGASPAAPPPRRGAREAGRAPSAGTPAVRRRRSSGAGLIIMPGVPLTTADGYPLPTSS